MQIPLSTRNNRGFTLIEVMVAILIMMVGLIGLLQSINVAMEYNLKNQLRDEAVYTAERYFNELRGMPFDSIPVADLIFTTPSKIRGGAWPLTVKESSTLTTHDTKLVLVVVTWMYKNVPYENRLTAPISRMPAN